MAEATLTVPPPAGSETVLSDATGWMPYLDAWLQLQRMPWDLLVAWQRGWVALQNEMFDDWACRWGGGAPIDA